jgi:ADP-heptose:LPS heptosyltransferase
MNFEFFVSNLDDLVSKANIDNDPYSHPDYRLGNKHFVQCFLEKEFGLAIPKNKILNPILVLDKDDFKNAEDTVTSMGISSKDKIAIVQFVGGTSYFSPENVQCTAFQKRVMPDECSQHIIDNLLSRGYKVIQYKLPKERKFNGTISIKKILDFRTWAAIFKKSNKIVCIDSSVSHIAPAVGKSALVFWSATHPTALGWSLNRNIKRSEWPCNGCGRPNTHYFDNKNWRCKFNFECGNYSKQEVMLALESYIDD